MFRFYTSKENIHDDYVEIEGIDVNHIKNVLRMKPSDHIIVCDGEGNDMECELWQVRSDKVVAKAITTQKSMAELDAKITLYQGLPKKDKMELIIQKAVELGVYKVVPVVTDNTVVKIDSKKEDKVITRWNSIAMAAAKQSGRGIIPKVENVVKFSDAIKEAKSMQSAIIPYEKAKGIDNSRQIIKGLGDKKEIAVFIGPEGGFSNEEIEIATNNGINTITLGHRILRTETAGLTVLSILMFELEKDGEYDDTGIS